MATYRDDAELVKSPVHFSQNFGTMDKEFSAALYSMAARNVPVLLATSFFLSSSLYFNFLEHIAKMWSGDRNILIHPPNARNLFRRTCHCRSAVLATLLVYSEVVLTFHIYDIVMALQWLTMSRGDYVSQPVILLFQPLDFMLTMSSPGAIGTLFSVSLTVQCGSHFIPIWGECDAASKQLD